MANFDWTSSAFSPADELQEPTPHWNLTARLFRKQQWNIEAMHRNMPTRHRATKFGWPGELVEPWFDNPWRPHKGSWRDDRYSLTAPQFTGTVSPAGAYTVRLCKRDVRTRRNAVVEVMQTDVSGNFASKTWHPAETDTEYFYQVEGDATYESNDFLINAPVRHEKQKSKDPLSGTVVYDSRNLRMLYVEDQFNGIQGTNLTAHTPDVDIVGSGWVNGGGTAQIGEHGDDPGEFVAYTLGSGSLNYIETNDADVLMHVPLIFGDASVSPVSHGAVIRASSTLNFLLISVTGANAANPTLLLQQYSGGTPTTLKIKPLIGASAFNVDQEYMMKVLCKDDIIWYEINVGDRIWGDIARGVTFNQTQTRHGFYLGTAGMYAKSIKIWSV